MDNQEEKVYVINNLKLLSKSYLDMKDESVQLVDMDLVNRNETEDRWVSFGGMLSGNTIDLKLGEEYQIQFRPLEEKHSGFRAMSLGLDEDTKHIHVGFRMRHYIKQKHFYTDLNCTLYNMPCDLGDCFDVQIVPQSQAIAAKLA